MDDQILYEVSDKVAVITLNRPHKANALAMDLLDDLDAAFEKAATDDEVRVIVRPLEGFGLGEHVRITIGLPKENERLVQALRRVRQEAA